MRVLLVERGLHVRSQLLGLFLQLINRNLAYEHGEIFRGRLHGDLTRLVVHSDVSLISQLEFFFISNVINVGVFLSLSFTCPFSNFCAGLLGIDFGR